jgi:uncharacterized protein
MARSAWRRWLEAVPSLSVRPVSHAAPATDAPQPFTLITGGSDGIGLAFARDRVRGGDNVLLVARTRERLDAAANTLRSAATGQVATLALDITEADATAKIDAALAERNGFVDVLINNAGAGLSGPFSGAAADAVASLVALNVTAPTVLTRHLLPGLLQRQRGGIIFVASLAGYVPGPGQAAYYASKAYLLSLSEALASECAGTGVRITCVAPGPVNTGFHARMGAETSWYRRILPAQSPEQVARLAWLAYRLGVRVVVPSVTGLATMLSLRILPHRLTVPVVRFLLSRPG